jgi:hypothetical protein
MARSLESVNVRPAGRGHFKNITEPVELFEIADRNETDAEADTDPEAAWMSEAISRSFRAARHGLMVTSPAADLQRRSEH